MNCIAYRFDLGIGVTVLYYIRLKGRYLIQALCFVQLLLNLELF